MAFAGGAATGGIVVASKKKGNACRKCRWALLLISIVIFVSIFSIVNLIHRNR